MIQCQEHFVDMLSPAVASNSGAQQYRKGLSNPIEQIKDHPVVALGADRVQNPYAGVLSKSLWGGIQ